MEQLLVLSLQPWLERYVIAFETPFSQRLNPTFVLSKCAQNPVQLLHLHATIPGQTIYARP
jgi:hypothetical protein